MVPEKIERLAPTARSFAFSDGAHRGVFQLSLQNAINASSAAAQFIGPRPVSFRNSSIRGWPTRAATSL
jgi:hypothetical protein